MIHFKVVFLFSVVLCTTVVTVLSDCSSLDQYFYIRNKVSGLVLDASDNKGIRIQPYNSSARYQQFRIKPASRTGLFNIINTYTERALGYLPVGEHGYYNEVNFTLIWFESSVYQEFFINGDGTIMNGGFYNYGIMVDQNPFYAGNFVYIASGENFGEDQQFELTNGGPLNIRLFC
ncbi:hypothetical protein Zmor_019996 [Zophobas morio]|uniref:Uncharacterized protein n=1 Tax=Zophobas morio TaxID=2755281 RepID=A0AA38M9J2_9CUCU|nr:hypothetical protein Zmor_019996 [Zophobas morio]